MKHGRPALLCVVVCLLAACGGSSTSPVADRRPAPSPAQEAVMQLTSGAFQPDQPIPTRYTCDGESVSPPLSWSDVPSTTGAFALIVDDPDAPGGVFTHWVVVDLPADTSALPEGVPATGRLDNGAVQGRNDFGREGYGPPCPPRGSPHHYRFTLYALDAPLGLQPGASKQQVLNAMQGHIRAEGRLVGTYQRAGR